MSRVNKNERASSFALALAAAAALFILLVAAIAASALLTSASLRDVERQRASVEEVKVSWIASQAEIELYRLALAAEQFAREPVRRRVELETRLDIYWSRVALLETVERRQRLSDLIASAVFPSARDMIADLEALDLLIGDRGADPEVVAAAVRAHAARWLPPLVAAARDLHQVDMKKHAAATSRVIELTATNLRNQIMLAGVVLVAGVYGALVLLHNRRLRDRAEDARQALADALALAPFAVAFLHEDGTLAAANSSFHALTEMDGDSWRPGETRDAHLGRVGRRLGEDPAAWLLTAIGAEPVDSRRIDSRPDGRHMLVEIVQDPDAGLAIAVSDVTTFVRTRTRAEDLSAERAELLAMVGHELRTPISALVGALDMAQVGPPEMRDAHLGSARHAADQLLSIADDVLDYTVLDDGIFSIRLSVFAPAEHLHAIAATHRPRAEAAGLELRLHLDDLEGSLIRSDRLRLRQILDNLIINAIKYAGLGWIEVRASLWRAGEAGVLTLEVEDSGPGIPAAFHGALFTPFRRFAASSDRGRSIGGLGLGLPICKRIADGLGGEIGYVAGVAGGALFRVRVPVAISSRAAEAWASPVPSAASPALRSASCLLLEDDDLLVEIHAAQLQRICSEVATARTVAEALRLTSARHFDLIVLDLLLPDGLGSEVAIAVRSAEAAGTPRSVMVMLTAYADAEAIAACRRAGVDEVFRKPLDLERLRSLLPDAAPAPAPAPPAEIGAIASLAAFPGDDMDAAIRADLVSLFPVDRIAQHVRELDADLATFLDGLEAGSNAVALEALAEGTHKLCGRAKLLGFRRLAERLTALEAACRGGRAKAVETAAEALCAAAADGLRPSPASLRACPEKG